MPELISITNVPADVGSVIRGKAAAPRALIASTDLISGLKALGYNVNTQAAFEEGSKSWKSAPINTRGVKNEEDNLAVCHSVEASIEKGLTTKTSKTPFQLVLGGECCMLPAIMSAMWKHYDQANEKLGLLYIDGDCDLTAPNEPGSSGNFAGMTMTHLTMRPGALDSMRGFSRPNGQPVVDNTNFVLFGLNIASPVSAKREHLGYLFDHEYRVITSAAVAKEPVEWARKAMHWFEDQGVDRILVHLDVDAIDAGHFPLANVANYTGASFEAILAAVTECLGSRKVCGLVIAEVNPDHDSDSTMTRRLADEIVKGFATRSNVFEHN